eukprot:scaffold32262_cov75-Phaeocystis_antarctica.AAC.3
MGGLYGGSPSRRLDPLERSGAQIPFSYYNTKRGVRAENQSTTCLSNTSPYITHNTRMREARHVRPAPEPSSQRVYSNYTARVFLVSYFEVACEI